MEKKPLVSVIVPIYGVEDYIVPCAESLFGQTYPELEYVFVNDGTPDHSMECLEALIDSRFPEKRSRIVRIDQENAGLPQARRRGLERASGDYILHVDSDDYLERDAVERLVSAAEGSGVDVVHFYVRKEFSGGRSRISRDREYPTPAAYARDIVSFHSHGYVCNKLMRRSVYGHEVFFPRYNMHEDIVLSCQLLHYAQSIRLLKEPLYHYRCDNGGAITHQKKSVRRGQSARNFLDLYEYWHERPDSPIREVERDLLLRAAWIAYTIDPTLFDERPYLKVEAAKIPLHIRSSKDILSQIRLKLWLRFHP